jgi:hypothetical protein
VSEVLQTAFFVFRKGKSAVKLSVTVSVDLDHTSVTIRVVGLLSTDNVGGFLAVVNRASRTLPDLRVRLDLEHLRSHSPEALHLLHQSVAEVAPGTVTAFNPPSLASGPRLAA